VEPPVRTPYVRRRTVQPEDIDAPIPLNDEDVLQFVIGDDEPAAADSEATTESPKAKKAKSKNAPKAKAKAKSKPKSKPKPEPQAEPESTPPAAEESGGDEAVADFLMNIELDDEDQR